MANTALLARLHASIVAEMQPSREHGGAVAAKLDELADPARRAIAARIAQRHIL
jgi:hypothetical protein